MLNKTLCVVPPTVISGLGLPGEMFPQTRPSSAKLARDFGEFGVQWKCSGPELRM